MRPQREDTLPWYKQFWPWFIIALPGSAVVAGLTTVWIAMQSDDSLVYKSDDGIDVVTERNLAAERTANASGLTANVMINAETGSVTASLTAISDLPETSTVQLELLHPTRQHLDLDAELVRAMANSAGEPTWAGHFVTPPSGRYYIVLSSGNDWRLSGEWNGEPSLMLGKTADGNR